MHILHLQTVCHFAGKRIWRRGNSGMKKELSKLMFSGDSLACLSEDSGKFCMVMSVFHNYEHSVSTM